MVLTGYILMFVGFALALRGLSGLLRRRVEKRNRENEARYLVDSVNKEDL